jgi:hypothetical protein
MVIDPTEGLPGTEITVTGEGCVTKGDLEVDVRLYDTSDVEQDADVVEPNLAGFGGEWEATLTVPADTTDYGEWTVDAMCQFEVVPAGVGTAGVFGIDYDDRIFTVLAPEPEPEPTPEPPAAEAAEVAPTFTG